MLVQFRKNALSNQWQVDTIKEGDEKLTGKVEIKGTKVIYPESIASGTSSYHKLDKDIELITTDLTFHTRTLFERVRTEKPEFYAMQITCNWLDLMRPRDESDPKLEGTFHSMVYWGISEENSNFVLYPGETLSGIIVYISNEFMQNALGGLPPVGTKEEHVSATKRALKTLTEHNQPVPPLTHSTLGKLQFELVQEILSLDNKHSVAETLLIKANIIKILWLYLTSLVKDDKKPVESLCSDAFKIFEIKKMLEFNTGNSSISLDHLAKRVGISKTKLKTKFKEIMGTTAYQYYLNVKMEKAKAILEDNLIPINEIADELGFKSTSHFSQAFKKHYGVTPKSIAVRA
jgi:AraC-like DNA-binding protein